MFGRFSIISKETKRQQGHLSREQFEAVDVHRDEAERGKEPLSMLSKIKKSNQYILTIKISYDF